MNKTVGILTMELYEGRQKNSVGSSRIRGTWLANHWPEAELFKIGKVYDTVIFQKAYHLDFMKIFPGVKILDLCDPDWLEGKPVKEAIELCDAVTCSSEALREFLSKITEKPVVFIPDRVDLTAHTERKAHTGRAERVVWFGYHGNHKVLDGALMTLRRMNLGITIISDMPYYPQGNVEGIDDEWFAKNVRNIKYDPETANQEIVDGGDIVINPKIDNGRFKFKSENKTYISWALGMPVAKDSDDIERFMDPEERQKEADLRRKEVEEKYDVRKSVEEFKAVIDGARKAKTN